MQKRQMEQLEALEQLRTEAVNRLADLGPAAVNRQPAAGGWSAAQVLFHVVEAERLSLAYLLKKTQKPDLIPRSGVLSAVKSRALSLFLKLPLKVSAPARTADVPDSVEMSVLERDWDEVRAGWREFLETFPSELADKAIYKHPVAGRLNLEQTLRFLVDHLERHLGQIDRVLAEGQAA